MSTETTNTMSIFTDPLNKQKEEFHTVYSNRALGGSEMHGDLLNIRLSVVKAMRTMYVQLHTDPMQKKLLKDISLIL